MRTGPLNDVIPRTFAFEFAIEFVIEIVMKVYIRIHWTVSPTSTQDPHYSVADATGSTLVPYKLLWLLSMVARIPMNP